jgi:dipeptidyl aminopeptidase/acylaminoacyl peptidase
VLLALHQFVRLRLGLQRLRLQCEVNHHLDQWIAFDSRAGAEANIYLVDPQGGVPRKLEIDIHGNSVPSWSRDGKWIYFVNGDDVSNESVWKVPSSGGHAIQLAQNGATAPIESTDGQYVYFVRNKRLWHVNARWLRGTGSEKHPRAGLHHPRAGLHNVGNQWFPFGSGIYFISHSRAKAAIEFFDLRSQKVRRV